jgi:hypothetical protein
MPWVPRTAIARHSATIDDARSASCGNAGPGLPTTEGFERQRIPALHGRDDANLIAPPLQAGLRARRS